MNYIYDIVLNFHEYYYQFFEWDKKDKIKNIMKIPVYRVSDKDILILKNNKVKIDISLLNQIKEKNKSIMCLVSNAKITVGLLFDSKGNLIKRSGLIFEEEDEVNEFCKNLKITKFTYIENIKQSPINNLRIEKEKKDIIKEYINQEKDISILKYLYYEYFKQEKKEATEIKKILTEELEKKWTKKQNNLYNIVKLLKKRNSLTK